MESITNEHKNRIRTSNENLKRQYITNEHFDRQTVTDVKPIDTFNISWHKTF